MARAVGFIEAEGFVPIFDAVDAMVKATEVDVRGATRLGGGIVAVAVAVTSRRSRRPSRSARRSRGRSPAGR